jgi:hypothetical protein
MDDDREVREEHLSEYARDLLHGTRLGQEAIVAQEQIPGLVRYELWRVLALGGPALGACLMVLSDVAVGHDIDAAQIKPRVTKILDFIHEHWVDNEKYTEPPPLLELDVAAPPPKPFDDPEHHQQIVERLTALSVAHDAIASSDICQKAREELLRVVRLGHWATALALRIREQLVADELEVATIGPLYRLVERSGMWEEVFHQALPPLPSWW